MFSNKTIAAFDSARSLLFLGHPTPIIQEALSTKHKGVSRNVSMSNNEITKSLGKTPHPSSAHYLYTKYLFHFKLKKCAKNDRNRCQQINVQFFPSRLSTLIPRK